ncbi:hypothetical protein ACLOJK_016094 [Asimina triloba]
MADHQVHIIAAAAAAPAPAADAESKPNNKTKTNTRSSSSSSVGSGDGEDDSDVKRRSNIPFEFPPGFRFNPHDDELIIHYLRNKVLNQPLPYNNIVDVNIYKYNPDQLIEKYKDYGEKDWYFFTPRDRKYRKGSRPNRSAGDGYWKATGADKPIKSNDQIIGCRKALVFYRGKPTKMSSIKTNWIMHEYRIQENPDRLLPRSDGSMRLDDWVLCRIHWKPEKTERPTKIQRRGDGQMISADGSELGELELGDNGSMPVYDCEDTEQDLMQNNQVGVFNIPNEYGAENWTSLPDFGQQYNTLRSLDCMNSVGHDPYTSFLTSDPNMYAPLTQVAAGGKPWRKEDFYPSKPENYDLSSQFDIYNKSVLDSQPLLDAEELLSMLPSTDTLHNTQAIHPTLYPF